MRQGDLVVTPLTPRIGAEVAALDLRRDLNDRQIEGLKAALAEHLVLFFRDQVQVPESAAQLLWRLRGRGHGSLVVVI